VYVEEIGLKLDAADHQRKMLGDADDEQAIVLYLSDGSNVAATVRQMRGARRWIPTRRSCMG
jgi:hypothetical protein